MISLENESCKLRALEPEDVDILYEWENNMQLWEVSHTLTPFSKYTLKKYIENSHLDIYESKQLRLVIEKDGKPAGLIDLFDFDPYHRRGGIGILIDAGYRKQGLAAEALNLFTDYAFGKLGLHQLYCNITQNNPASIRLFEKNGFRKIGVKKDWIYFPGEYFDVVLFQKINPAD